MTFFVSKNNYLVAIRSPTYRKRILTQNTSLRSGSYHRMGYYLPGEASTFTSYLRFSNLLTATCKPLCLDLPFLFLLIPLIDNPKPFQGQKFIHSLNGF